MRLSLYKGWGMVLPIISIGLCVHVPTVDQTGEALWGYHADSYRDAIQARTVTRDSKGHYPT